jgi:hypothetical protein
LSDKHTELLEAAKAVLPLLKASTDKLAEPERTMTAAELLADIQKSRAEMSVPRAEKLRREADEIEAKDAAILRFRSAIDAFGEPVDPDNLEAAIKAAVREEFAKRN